jgi:uncharacterized membrane protein YgcG
VRSQAVYAAAVCRSRSDAHAFRRGSFAVYTAGTKGAAVFCIHGGGYTGLTWSLVAQSLKDRCAWRVGWRMAGLRRQGLGALPPASTPRASRAERPAVHPSRRGLSIQQYYSRCSLILLAAAVACPTPPSPAPPPWPPFPGTALWRLIYGAMAQPPLTTTWNSLQRSGGVGGGGGGGGGSGGGGGGGSGGGGGGGGGSGAERYEGRAACHPPPEVRAGLRHGSGRPRHTPGRLALCSLRRIAHSASHARP